MDLKAKVMSGLGWSAGMRFFSQLLTWVVTIFVIRLLSPSDYGVMELAGIFISFLTMIGELGLGSAIIQRHDLDEDQLKPIFGLIMLVSMILCASLSIAAPFIAQFYNEPLLSPIIWCLSSIFLFSGLATVPYSLLMREQNYRSIAIIDFVSILFGSITTLALALHGFGVWALVANTLTIRIISMLGFFIAKPFNKLPSFSFSGIGSVLIFSGNVTISRILWHFYSFASATLIVGKLLGKEALGIYGIALYLACLPMEKVGGIINQVAFPAFASIQNDPNLAGAHFLKAVRIVTIIAVPVFWGISSIAPEIIGIFLGHRWLDAVLPLQIIALVVPLRMVRNLMMPALLGLGHSKINLLNEAIAVLFMSVSFYFAASWGIVGISLVWPVVFPIVFLLNLPQTAGALCVKIWDIFSGMLWPMCAGLAMIIGIEIFRKWMPADIISILKMLIFIFIGAFVYITVIFFMNRSGVNELLNLVKKNNAEK